jgi:hypothetical protein
VANSSHRVEASWPSGRVPRGPQRQAVAYTATVDAAMASQL